jgi:hypothetical protein
MGTSSEASTGAVRPQARAINRQPGAVWVARAAGSGRSSRQRHQRKGLPAYCSGAAALLQSFKPVTAQGALPLGPSIAEHEREARQMDTALRRSCPGMVGMERSWLLLLRFTVLLSMNARVGAQGGCSDCADQPQDGTKGNCVAAADPGQVCHPTCNAGYRAVDGSGPEILLAKTCDEKVDVFSYAMCLVELVDCKLPWSGIAMGAEVPHKVTRGERPLQQLSGTDDRPVNRRLVELIKSCWDAKASRRPDFTTIIQLLKDIRSSESTSTVTEEYRVR